MHLDDVTPAAKRRKLEPDCGIEIDEAELQVAADRLPCVAALSEPLANPNGLIALTSDEDEVNCRLVDGEMVCYGMVSSDVSLVEFHRQRTQVPAVIGKCDRQKNSAKEFAVIIDSHTRFKAKDDPQRRGKIFDRFGHMIDGLLKEELLELHVSCTIEPEPAKSTAYLQSLCNLEITIYGPFSYELFEDLGNYFQGHDVYLQDPRASHQDVRYCNPHRLSSETLEDCPKLSEVASRASGPIQLQEVSEKPPDLLDILDASGDLDEAPQPQCIKTDLRRHQKQALTFMLRREKGWEFSEESTDIWETSDSSRGQTFFTNRISGAYQTEAPPQFLGGIIADPMGLGKTLAMIALMATDLDSGLVTGEQLGLEESDRRDVQATLVVVPQPLLNTWEEQLNEHVPDGSLKVCRHHAKKKLTEIREIDAVNVVLTTYDTLSADWKAWVAQKAKDSHIMFGVRWKRIVLDEAHVIRNTKSRKARAANELDSLSRWAVTGTPIQNHLNDLAALLKFIRVSPYDDLRRFETDISKLWKNGEAEEAVKRLKRLSRCLLLRRAKRTINLPYRRDTLCPVEFNKAERALYDDIKHQTILSVEDAIQNDKEPSKSGVYVNFLQRIESMRLVCNLGVHYHSRHDMQTSQETADWSVRAQSAFNMKRNMETIVCSQCSSSLELTDTSLEPLDYTDVLRKEGLETDDDLKASTGAKILPSDSADNPQFSRCLKYACTDCSRQNKKAGKKMVCGHFPLCPIASVSTSESAFEEAFSQLQLPQQKHTSRFIELPSKIDVLTADLKSLPSDVKCIVFSTWRLTLDIVEAGLAQAGIRCVRFDGKVQQIQRQNVLKQFKTDSSVRVMLLTLSCGAVGLTLTEASRAYLMEPHWNPTIEEQALARIHRIGQKREVTTVRFYIRDSFEQRVMQVQESKKNLAEVLLAGHDGSQADDSLTALHLAVSLVISRLAASPHIMMVEVRAWWSDNYGEELVAELLRSYAKT